MKLPTVFALLAVSPAVFCLPLEVPLFHSVIDEWLTLPDLAGTKLHEQDAYYVANVGLGTPVQKFNLTIDANVFWSFVLSNDLKQRTCYEDPGTRHVFDTSRSTTLHTKKTGDNYRVTILVDVNKGCFDFSGQYGWAQGDQVTDDFTIGGVPSPKIPFIVLRQLNGTMAPNLASDGLLGLSRGGGDTYALSTIQTLAESVGEPVVSFTLDRPPLQPVESVPTPGGLMTIGSSDHKNCKGKWTSLPVSVKSTPVWNVQMSSLHVGKLPIPLASGLALFDISSAYISFHTGLLLVVAEAVGASYDAKLEQFYVDCAKVGRLPDLVFTLQQGSSGGSYEFRVPGRDYARSLVYRIDGRCNVLFRPISELLSPSYNARYIIGSSGAISHCWAYDFGQDAIAFTNEKGL